MAMLNDDDDDYVDYMHNLRRYPPRDHAEATEATFGEAYAWWLAKRSHGSEYTLMIKKLVNLIIKTDPRFYDRNHERTFKRDIFQDHEKTQAARERRAEEERQHKQRIKEQRVKGLVKI